MAGNVSDEAFARYVNQIGNAGLDQIEAARTLQAEIAKKGIVVSLGEVLVQQGILTAAMRENVEKKLQAQQQGGLKQLGQYKLLKKLGEGGMGAVYLAEDTGLGRKVALKVLPKKLAGDKEFLSRFRREAQATANLNHVNIVSAYAVGEELGFNYYAMEYCDGESLDSLLKKQKRLACDQAVEIVMQVARGLKHAHEHGIIHRDIKPANIFICAPLRSTGVPPVKGQNTGETPVLQEGFVAKILDLGLAKTVGGTEQQFYTQAGVALGTPHYLSPEQARSDKNIDGRTDIYSLGATFYHLVTGQTPYAAPTAALIMVKHINEQLPNPQEINADIPDGVAHVIMRMTAKKPEDRYHDCRELLDDLELVKDGKRPSSQALDKGKSSAAMRRVGQAVQPAGKKPAHDQQARQPAPPRERARAVAAHGIAKPARNGTSVGKYIACGVAVLGAVVLILALGMGSNRDRDEQGVRAAAEKQKADEAVRVAEEKRKAGEARLKAEAARSGEEWRKQAEDKRKAEEARLEEEKRRLAEERRKLEEARATPEAEAKKKAEATKSETRNPKSEGNTKVETARTEPKAGETPAVQTAAEARAEKAQQLFSAVLKETAPLLKDNKLSDAIALLERKAKDPALSDAAELLKQEKADVEAVVELRKATIEALRKQAGQQITLKKGGTEFKGRVVNDPSPPTPLPQGERGVTLDMGGAQMTFNAMQLSLEDVDQYAPPTGNADADLRQRGIMYLAGGNVAKAKEYFTKPQTLNAERYLSRIIAIETGELEAAALKAWEKAERFFAAKEMKSAKAAYEAFQRDYCRTQTATKHAKALEERFEAIEEALAPPKEIALDLGGGVKMELVLVKAGEFMMGADDGEGCKPVHKVKISKPFYMGRYEVTVAQFRAFADATKFKTEAEKAGEAGTWKDGNFQGVNGVNWRTPGFPQEDNYPACAITWNDAQAFLKWAAKKTGRAVTLPSEAQWEYACRAGTTTKFNTGDQDSDLEQAAWFDRNSGMHANAVGQKKPNAWGLYDMHGNMWEWVQDYYNDTYYVDSPPVDPKGPASGGARVLRGGSLDNGPDGCRSARRDRGSQGRRQTTDGFRCVVDL